MVSGKVPHRMGNGHPNLVPYQAFRVSDGEIIVAVGNDRQFTKFCEVLSLTEVTSDDRFRTNAGRVRHRAELIPLLETAMLKRQRLEIAEALETAGIPAGPINNLEQVFADPQVASRGMRIDGPVPGLASPIVIDGNRQVAERLSPAFGGEGPPTRGETL
jgi:crotonobetainyl-CoA:carnitine CoA-transferase CaiB-like acyl-CoA transferase